MLILLGACSPETGPASGEEAAGLDAEASPAVQPEAEQGRPPVQFDLEEVPSKRPASQLLAAELVREEWAKAENREICAPVAFLSDAGARGTARRAEFSAGWAVAFDTPAQRSAYGVAGPGPVPADMAKAAQQAERLGAQWPYFTTLPNLPTPAFAGYGVEGAEDYPSDNPGGRGLNSLAYVRVGGQKCTYNVWSRLGRAHLEALMVSLRILN